jgi:hypothetical protein
VVVMVVVMMVTMGWDDDDARPGVMMMMVVMVTELHRDLGRLHVARFRVTPCIVGLQRRHCVWHRA